MKTEEKIKKLLELAGKTQNESERQTAMAKAQLLINELLKINSQPCDNCGDTDCEFMKRGSDCLWHV